MNPFTPNGRIVGGSPTTIEEVPHQVSLEAYGFSFCGGSIISEDWVVTAGHCSINYPSKWMSVRAGSTQFSTGGTVHPVVKLIRHENYTTNFHGIPENDIALLQVETPFLLGKSRQPIALFEQDEEVEEGALCTITGWGSVIEGGSTSKDLRTVDLPIISKKVCNAAYSSFGGIPKNQICAAYPKGGKDACQGDSGGPLTVGGRLAGIVSWGNGCAREGYPGAYTEVAAYRNWILKNSDI